MANVSPGVSKLFVILVEGLNHLRLRNAMVSSNNALRVFDLTLLLLSIC